MCKNLQPELDESTLLALWQSQPLVIIEPIGRLRALTSSLAAWRLVCVTVLGVGRRSLHVPQSDAYPSP